MQFVFSSSELKFSSASLSPPITLGSDRLQGKLFPGQTGAGPAIPGAFHLSGSVKLKKLVPNILEVPRPQEATPLFPLRQAKSLPWTQDPCDPQYRDCLSSLGFP